MIYLGGWHSVATFETLVAYGGQVHVRSLFSNFDTLEFSIVEIIGVVHILDLSGVHLVL